MRRLRTFDMVLIVAVGLVFVMVGVMSYAAQITTIKSCVVTSTYVPFGASHSNAHVTCQDYGSTADAVWSQLQNGCEPRVGDKVTITFYRALWNPQLTGDSSC